MKILLKNRTFNKWLGFSFALGLFLLTIFLSNQFVEELKEEEKAKIQIFAKALEANAKNMEVSDPFTSDLMLKVLQSNKTIPTMLIEEDNTLTQSVNVSEKILSDSNKLNELIFEMKKQRKPIEIELIPGSKQYVIFQHSELLTKLQYYPIILIFLILLFAYFSFWYFRTLKNTQQSFLWAGMAKETAHQIGTPLSSLMGWVELLKLENIDQEAVIEIEKDVFRLNQITERFSKIGSLPELKSYNITEVTKKTFSYLKTRISKNVQFYFYSEKEEIIIPLNAPLYSWVIENLIKNAVDAMQNKGSIEIKIKQLKQKVEILILDTGSGIPKSLQKRIFEPGYTTKKRGWGLGLSLAKRIINDYHKGKIKVLKSDKNGTTFQILLDVSA